MMVISLHFSHFDTNNTTSHLRCRQDISHATHFFRPSDGRYQAAHDEARQEVRQNAAILMPSWAPSAATYIAAIDHTRHIARTHQCRLLYVFSLHQFLAMKMGRMTSATNDTPHDATATVRPRYIAILIHAVIITSPRLTRPLFIIHCRLIREYMMMTYRYFSLALQRQHAVTPSTVAHVIISSACSGDVKSAFSRRNEKSRAIMGYRYAITSIPAAKSFPPLISPTFISSSFSYAAAFDMTLLLPMPFRHTLIYLDWLLFTTRGRHAARDT